MPSNREIYDMIVFYAEQKIPDEMRREAFLTNAYNALLRNNTEYLMRYLQRVKPPVQGGMCRPRRLTRRLQKL